MMVFGFRPYHPCRISTHSGLFSQAVYHSYLASRAIKLYILSFPIASWVENTKSCRLACSTVCLALTALLNQNVNSFVFFDLHDCLLKACQLERCKSPLAVACQVDGKTLFFLAQAGAFGEKHQA